MVERGRVLAVGLVFAALAWAASGLELELASYKVLKFTNDQGEVVEKTVPAAEVAPGDVLLWVLTAQNASGKTLERVALTIPIPPHTVYVAGSARPLKLGELTIEPLFSYDGTHFARPPLKKRVKVQEGDRVVEKEVVVPPEAYTHVRWLVPELRDGEKVQVSLRTQVR